MDEAMSGDTGDRQRSAAETPTIADHLRLSRRGFLIGGGFAAAIAAVPGCSTPSPATRLVTAGLASLDRALGAPTFTRMFRRREDFVYLRFDFYNLVRDTRAGAKPQLIRKLGAFPAYVVVTFPPQAIAERAYPEPGSGPSSLPIASILAAPSRLGFQIPASVSAIPFSADGLLAWTGWNPLVVPAADTWVFNPRFPTLAPVPREPLPQETAIEMPWGMFLSPSSSQTWAHSTSPVTHNGRTEVWHSRLGQRAGDPSNPTVDERDSPLRTIRSVWYATYFDPDPNGMANNLALSPVDRIELTEQMSNQRANPGNRPAHLNRMHLTALGGTLDVEGSWDRPLESWRHIMTMGRDHYVKIVRRGFLYPFGHRAVKVEITERKFEGERNPTTALLRKRTFIVVREPVRSYQAGPGSTHPDASMLRRFPFRTVEMVTTTTPSLDRPGDGVGVPFAAGNPVLFKMLLTDLDGNVAHVAMPLVFTPIDPKDASAVLGTATGMAGALKTALANADPELSGLAPLNGQNVAFAAGSTGRSDGTTLRTAGIGFGGVQFGAGGPIRFDGATGAIDLAPVIDVALVKVDAVVAITGVDTPVYIRHAASYIDEGMDGAANKGAAFAEFVDRTGKVATTFRPALDGSTAGGLANLAMEASGLSREFGPVGDLEKLAQEQFDPRKLLGDARSKLLGAVDLASIIPTIPGTDKASSADAPRIVTDLVYPGGDRKQPPTGSKTTFDWTPRTRDVEPFFFVSKSTSAPTVFEVHGLIDTNFRDSGASTTRFWGRLTNVTVKLFGGSPFITIPVHRVAFESRTGSKTTFDVDLGEITFGEPLTFVTELAKLLRFGGKGGPYVDVTPSGVTAGVAIGIPNIQLGVFQLSNVAFSVGAHLPFQGEFTLDFAFCRHEQPCTLAIACFGGGAWVEISIGMDGLRKLDIGFEFGAAVAVSLGVASGEVHVFAGIYLVIDTTSVPEVAKLGGYIRLGGSVCVLGIVTVSIELQLGFEFDAVNTKAVAYGTLHLEVDIFLVSKSFSIEVEKRFGAKAEDPTFRDQVDTQEAWDSYCNAFATVGS